MNAAQGLAANWSSGSEKTVLLLFVLHIHYYYYYFLSCLIKLSVAQHMSFPFCPILLPIPLRGKGTGERVAVWCLVASCWAKP